MMEEISVTRWAFCVVLLAALICGCVSHQTESTELFRYSASYEGVSEVEEGYSFELSCHIKPYDFPKWTINGVEITEDNEMRYTLESRRTGKFDIEMTLSTTSAQHIHEGEYRCNAYSRDFHFLEVIRDEEKPEEEEDDDDDDDDEDTSPSEFILREGETITLDCGLIGDDTDISWFKNGKKIDLRYHTNLHFSGRKLIIEEARESDAGQYICDIDKLETGFAAVGRLLKVKTPARITSFPALLINIKETQDLELRASFLGYPVPNATWYIGNERAEYLEDKRILTATEEQTSFVIIKNLTLADRGLYTFRVNNSVDGKSMTQDEMSVFIHVRDIATSDLSSSTKYVVKGGEFTLLCPVPQPQTELQLWHKDSKSIKVDARNNYILKEMQSRSNGSDTRFFTIMSLTVKEADEIHTGVYQCRNLSQKVIVVTENMIVTNEDFPGMGKLLIPGEQLILYCNTTECPSCTVLWSKDGEELTEVDGHLEIYDNNSVVINEASYNDTGVYVCAIDKKTFDFTLSASLVVQSKIKIEKFESSSSVVVEGNPLELHCLAKGAPTPYIKWFKGDEEITSNHPRIKLYEHNGLSDARLLIEEAEFEDRDYYTCEAYNQINSANTTVFIRIKDKLAALWPFLGICAEVAILCSIIFVYERRKSKAQFEERDTDHPAENKHPKDQKAKDQDMRQRK